MRTAPAPCRPSDLVEEGKVTEYVARQNSRIPGSCLAPAPEIVSGKAEHGEALILVARVQRLQAVVLRSQPAPGGDVDHEQHPIRVVGQRAGLLVIV